MKIKHWLHSWFLFKGVDVHKYFLYWWIVFILICGGSIWGYLNGLFEMTNRADVTKISFLIYGLFMIFTARLGSQVYAFAKCLERGKGEMAAEDFQFRLDSAWFASDVFLSLGMLGTIIGYIYVLAINFMALDPANFQSMQQALRAMGIGMGTALYTTAWGLTCGVLMKFQLFIFSHQLEGMLRRKP